MYNARRKEKSRAKDPSTSTEIQVQVSNGIRFKLIEKDVTTQNITCILFVSLAYRTNKGRNKSAEEVGHIQPPIMGQHESDPATQKVTGKCFLSYVITLLS